MRNATIGDASDQCKWRMDGAAFINAKIGSAAASAMKEKLLYTHLLDLAGIASPRCARMRLLLNTTALMPQVQPVQDTLAVLDITQGFTRCALRTDGSVPVAVTGTVYYSLQACRQLSVVEMGELMGHRMCEMNVGSISETSFRALLGNGVHVASMGMFLTGMLGSMALQASDDHMISSGVACI